MSLRVFSTFSGISAATVAWKPLGYEFVGYCEPEPLPCHVLAARCEATAPIYLPEGFRRENYKHIRGGSIPNFGDIESITDADLEALGPVDVLEGGSPCQDFSLAGLRKGLAGERGNLTLAFVRLALRMRELNQLKYIVWENVHGVLSDKTNAFGAMVAAMVGGSDGPLLPPRDGWRRAGHVAGPAGAVAWRTLDAQFWGVPQRRKRVFLVGRTGDRHVCPGTVLFDQIGEGWNSETRGGTRTGSTTSAVGGTSGRLGDGAEVIAFMGGQGPRAGSIAASRDLAPTLRAADSGSNRTPCVVHPRVVGTLAASGAGTMRAAGQKNEPDFCIVQQMDGGTNWIVRRLLPVECERLQGFEDGWTDVPYKGKARPLDGPRYKALGNSMAVPCMRYIGERLQAAHYSDRELFDEAA